MPMTHHNYNTPDIHMFSTMSTFTNVRTTATYKCKETYLANPMKNENIAVLDPKT